MTDIYSAQARAAHFNHTVDEYHRKVATILGEIDHDLVKRKLYGSSANFKRIDEVLAILRFVPEEMVAFDSRHAEYSKGLLSLGRKSDGINPFCEPHELELIEWLAAEADRIPETIRQSRSIAFHFPDRVNWLPRAQAAAKRIAHDVTRSYGEARASFELKSTGVATPAADGPLAPIYEIEPTVTHAVCDQPPRLELSVANEVGPPAQAKSVDDNAFLTSTRLAELLGVEHEAFRKRLERWRRKNAASKDYVENTSRGPNDPQYLYRFGLAKTV